MGNFRIPVPVAVVAWAASGLAVLSYTYLAFKETANGAEPTKSGRGGGEPSKQELQDLVSILPELHPGDAKKELERHKFEKSRR